MKTGVLIAGNIIVDFIKLIDAYPNKLALTSIQSTRKSLGGLVPNVGIDLAKLDSRIPISLMGYVGKDEEGRFAVEQMDRYPNIDCSMIKIRGKTSFTDVMTIANTGERTFFTYKGADGLLGLSDFDFGKLGFKLMHIGYILLMDGLDKADPQYGTVLAKILCNAQNHGIETSIDVVSECGDRFRKLVIPALRYSDYCTINEMEAEQVTGVQLRTRQDKLKTENMESALKALKGHGVRRWVTIHAPEGAFGLDKDGDYVYEPSRRLPAGFIKDSVGAGDAFVAGLLYSAYMGWEYRTALTVANAAAVMSLSQFGATQGVGSIDQILKQMNAR
jgi:sugar/nucleoside kinase (ribokinase family)